MFFKDKLKLVKLPVSRILPNPAQPRKDFDQAALESLAQSIKENGLLQPVTVRLSEAPGFGQPVLYYDKSSRGAQAYGELAAEILKNNR